MSIAPTHTYVPFLVRRDLLDAVATHYKTLDPGMSAAEFEMTVDHHRPEPDVLSDSPATRSSDDDRAWSVADLHRLAKGDTVTTQRWARAMDVCAEQPGVLIGSSELARRAGMSITEWRDAPRKIRSHLSRHYPDVPRSVDGNPHWPLHGESSPDYPGEISWVMSPLMAERWQQVRA